MSDHQPPLTLEEAASYLNITERYMRRLVAERRVAFLKLGRLLRFRPDDLDELLDRCRIEPSPSRLLPRGLRRWDLRLMEAGQQRFTEPGARRQEEKQP